MAGDLDEVLSRLRQAEDWDATAFERLVAILRDTECVAEETLLSLFVAPESSIRAAAVDAGCSRLTDAVVAALRAASHDPHGFVRHRLASKLQSVEDSRLDDVRTMLLGDADDQVRAAAVSSARLRADLAPRVLLLLQRDAQAAVRDSAAASLAAMQTEAAVPSLFAALAEDLDDNVANTSAQGLDRLIEHGASLPTSGAVPAGAHLARAARRLESLGRGRFPALARWLAEHAAGEVDADELRTFGPDLTTQALRGEIPRAFFVDSICEAAIAALLATPRRSVVLVGESGCGKTAVVHEVVHKLHDRRAGRWTVLRVSPSDILSGTRYLGELQTRVRALVDATRAPKRVVLYIPNLEELSEAGKSTTSDLNVASALAPHIEDGSIAVLGETTPEQFQRGLGGISSLRRLFHTIEVPSLPPDRTLEVLERVRDASGTTVADSVLRRIAELSDCYLPSIRQPGRAVGLLRGALDGRSSAMMPLGLEDVLRTLSRATGMPMDILDDNVPLDDAVVRTFFESRVMGQPEAVDAVADLVTLVKAGLNDPEKPFGVLLFVGPTGVGKTELARALAEYLFGDVTRLVRLDMSEFSSPEAHERLIGARGAPGLLTAAVHARPFSVVLLDEIEKAHINVFDLCLQIFDAGRLTGRTCP